MLKTRRGSKVYVFGLLVAQVLALGRYTLLARLLGPEQLGLAATLILTAQFFDAVTDSGSDRFLIQDANGDDPNLQKLVQLVFIGRGAMIALGLVLLCRPLSLLYGAPRLAPALALLALPPLVMGFLHLDVRRVQRGNDFRAEGLMLLVSECCGFAGLIAAALIWREFWAVLVGLLFRALAAVCVSHLTASRRYSVGLAREYTRQLARFSAPLMLTGVLLFLGSQGDRIFVANKAGVTELGLYSAVLLLIYYPSAMIQRMMMAMYLPLIAAARGEPEHREAVVDRLAGQSLLLAIAMAAGFVVVAPTAILILFGHRFAPAAGVVALVGVLQTSRFMILWPTTTALALGRSGLVLAANCARLLAYPLALGGVLLFSGLKGILSGFIAGETIALCVLTGLLAWLAGEDGLKTARRLVIFVASAVVILLWGGAFGSVLAQTWAGRGVLLVATVGLIGAIVRSELTTLRSLSTFVRLPLASAG